MKVALISKEFFKMIFPRLEKALAHYSQNCLPTSNTTDINMTVKDLLEKVAHTCCGAIGLNDDEGNSGDGKPLPIYGNPNKKKTNKVEQKQEQAPAKTPSTTTTKFKGKETKYEVTMWDDLPKGAKDAAAVLGFDKESWDTDKWLDIQDYWWEDMSEEQKTAATTLGWDVTSWDNKYEQTEWKDVPNDVKKAAESLGFTQEMWDDDSWPEGLEHKDHDELTKDEKAAVAVMGYNKLDWD